MMGNIVYKTKIVFLVSLLTSITSLAPLSHVSAASTTQEWQQKYSVNNTSVGETVGIARDNSGNVYVANNVQDQSTFVFHVYVAKYDPSGNRVWSNSYGIDSTSVKGSGVATDSEGNLYLFADASGSYAVVKFGADGTQEWASMYSGGVDHYILASNPHTIAVDGQGNVYIVGGEGQSLLTIKYDTDGNQIWKQDYTSDTNVSGIGIELSSSGGVYITGVVNPFQSNSDIVVVKYDTDGGQVWAQTFDSGGAEFPQNIISDSSDNVYIVGDTESQTSQLQSYVTLKYSSNGDRQWAKFYGSSNTSYNATSLAVDHSGNVYVVGGGSAGSYSLKTIKYTADGTQSWISSYSGNGAAGLSVQLDSSDRPYVIGRQNSTSGHGLDSFILGYETDGTQTSLATLDNGGQDIVRNGLFTSSHTLYTAGVSCDINFQSCQGDLAQYTTSPNLVAPDNVQASSPTKVFPHLTWDAVTNANMYNVYRSGTLVGTTSTTAFTDSSAAEGNLNYYVTAVNEDAESPHSSNVTVVYDTTSPSMTYSTVPAANAAGWNNTDVTINFTCSDALSGVSSCTAPIVISTEGVSQTVNGSSTDYAGNAMSITTSAIKIDKTAPTISTPTISKKVIPHGGTVTITATTTDSLSGVLAGEYYIDTDPGVGNASPMTYANGKISASATIPNLPAGSKHKLYMRSIDAAGNWSTTVFASFSS